MGSLITTLYPYSTMWTHCLALLVLTCVTLQDVGTSFQERHRMMIQPKTESCFFLADMQEEYVINIRYLVMSSKNGKQLDISMRLRDNTKRMITYQGRKTHGTYNHTVKTAGDYEICFNNRHSMLDSKKLVWEFDILGDEDVVQSHEEVVLAINQTMEDYLFKADMVRKSVMKVRTNLARSKHSQWWLGNKIPKDMARLESIISMIDTWSMAYSCLVVVVGVVQLFVLKRFFKETPTTSKLRMRI